MKKKLLLLGFVVSIVFFSCNRNPVEPQVVPQIEPATGLFVLNEGSFTYANSSLSYYDIEGDSVINNLFFKVNNAPIGDIGQSLTAVGNSLYIVVNNSNYIYKVDKKTIQYQEKLEDFKSPRYMLPIGNGKTYVSDLIASGIWVIDLNTLSHKKFIETGNSTEAMVKVGNEVFVSNWSKYYIQGSSNKTVQVIDCVNDELVGEIEVAQEPNAMIVDKNDNIWVLCSGGVPSESSYLDPALICINPSTRQIIKRFDFAAGSYPSGLAIDGKGENVFFMNGEYESLDVYKISIDATQLPDTPFITSDGKWFYNLKVDPHSGDVYVTETFRTKNGNLFRYSSEGTLLGTFEVGMFPGYMLFN